MIFVASENEVDLMTLECLSNIYPYNREMILSKRLNNVRWVYL